ncbi:MAG: GTP-binding protein [Bacillota bacterium]|nr:GTP-binding protein [Bacillota bacterium]
MTDVIVISGFLGAGKTTLIQKLLTESFSGRRVALVENDFGEVNVDASLMKDEKIEITELCDIQEEF